MVKNGGSGGDGGSDSKGGGGGVWNNCSGVCRGLDDADADVDNIFKLRK